MISGRHVAVPIGLHAGRWITVPTQRTVLFVAHNVTTVTRLLDVLPAFDNDVRVQVVLTCIGADPFHDGLPTALDDTGLIVIPWEQATQLAFDLAITASHHGALSDISAPLVILSHGIGYTKYSPRKAGKPESRKAGKPESRKAGKPESLLAFRRSGYSATASR